ncbi:hypothetical protein WMY93_012158 [Mugilogobius chulae]|uniref:Keratin type II head domain-containing protein n=1 Tax=Mugilogobius chulae TaxID=88201 RepID=A0AAW0P846_9GOBI
MDLCVDAAQGNTTLEAPFGTSPYRSCLSLHWEAMSVHAVKTTTFSTRSSSRGPSQSFSSRSFSGYGGNAGRVVPKQSYGVRSSYGGGMAGGAAGVGGFKVVGGT